MGEKPYLDVGYKFPEWDVKRTAGDQAERLRSSDVDPALYGEYQETAMSGLDCFRTMNLGGMPIDGYVHIGQRFRQHDRIRLGESLTVKGRVESVGEHPRGTRVHHVYDFTRKDGTIPLTSEVFGLLPYVGKNAGPGERPAREDAPGDETAGLICLEKKTLTPSKVIAFSRDVGNEIHFDPAFAARYGFRAPLAQGLMSAVWMMSPLARKGVPGKLDVFIRFMRPVFWDDIQFLWVREAGERNGTFDLVRSIGPHGKVSAEMIVESITYPEN
jgi:acyl dehydratase